MLGYNSNYAHGRIIYVLFNIRPRVGGKGKNEVKRISLLNAFDDDCSPTVVERITAILKTLAVIKC